MNTISELVDRYIAAWNEPDAEQRRRRIEALWSEGGAHFTKMHQVRGYAALETRIAGAYEKWVRTAGYVFKPGRHVDGHHDTVKFTWEMVPAGGGKAVSVGFDFLILGEDGRIRVDYQFLEPTPPS